MRDRLADIGDFWEFTHMHLPDDGGHSPERTEMLVREIERRDNLMYKVNVASRILLQSEADGFEDGLLRGMGVLAKAVDADVLGLWRNRIRDGELYCERLFEWSAIARPRGDAEIAGEAPYRELPGWENILSQGGCINGLTREMSGREKARLSLEGILAIFVAPIFTQDVFWGFVSYEYLGRERIFSADEQSILRATGATLAAACMRHEMTLDIRATADKLREASEAKSRFLASMSHEMRTPLNAVIGLSTLLMRDGGLDREALACLGKINQAGSVLLDTVNRILDISKIEEGKFELVPTEYDVADLVDDVVAQSAMLIGDKPIEFVLDVDGGLPGRLYGDDLRVKHVLNNLLSNAFKYTSKGTVTLSVKCERAGKSAWVTAEVSDTGAGIRSEDMDRLFGEYAKLDAKSNRGIEGTGLGLYITKRVVEMMGGSISAQSERGKGSVFTARFRQRLVGVASIGEETANDLKKSNYRERGRNFFAPRISLPDARVLVVDDARANLDVAVGMLKAYGMRVDCASGGREAVEAVRAGRPRYDAIFMDHMMPEMDGIEAVAIIRQMESDYAKNVPIIAFTANAIVGNEEMFLSRGFQAFVSKPIDAARLDAAIREWVGGGKPEKAPPRGGDAAAFPAEGFSLPQIDGLDVRVGLGRLGGDAESYLRALRSFAADARAFLKKGVRPDAAGADRDAEAPGETLANYAVAVHGIKGAGANVGALRIAEKARELEAAAVAGDLAFTRDRHGDFAGLLEKFVSALGAFPRTSDRRREKPAEGGIARETLGRLLAACEAGDVDAVDGAMAEIEGLAAWLRENADGMNHAAMAEKLRGLK